MPKSAEHYLMRYAELRGQIKKLSHELSFSDCGLETVGDWGNTCIKRYRQQACDEDGVLTGDWPWLRSDLRKYNHETGEWEIDHQLDGSADLCPGCVESLRLIRERKAAKQRLAAFMGAMCRAGQALTKQKGAPSDA